MFAAFDDAIHGVIRVSEVGLVVLHRRLMEVCGSLLLIAHKIEQRHAHEMLRVCIPSLQAVVDVSVLQQRLQAFDAQQRVLRTHLCLGVGCRTHAHILAVVAQVPQQAGLHG